MSNQSEEYLNRIKNNPQYGMDFFLDASKLVSEYLTSTNKEPSEDAHIFESFANEEDDILKKIFFYSVAIYIYHSIQIFNNLLDLVWDEREGIELDALNFLYWQFVFKMFSYPELKDLNTQAKVWNILKYNISRYESLCSDLLDSIPISERDESFILVITDQFLSYQHGPTKTAADRCKILIENLKKRVLLLNTAEVMNSQGFIPFYDPSFGSYNNSLLNAEFVEWKSCKIPYFQCDNIMPNLDLIRIVLSMVRKMRPLYTVAIGSGGVLATLISKFIPSISIGLLPSGVSITEIPFQTLSRQLNEDDRTLLNMVGRTENSIVIGTFGSSILNQTVWLTREEVGLPSDAWLAALVGGRLNQELTSDFWNMAEKSSQYGLEYVVLGSYSQSNLESVEAEHPLLKGKIHNMGFVKDVLSYMDLCDLYINPIRAGGGTSCVEALSVGVPVITTRYGDVAVNVGEKFQTDSYDSMISQIYKYISDFEYYKSQSLEAKKRSEILLNAEDSFINILSEFLKRNNLTL